MTLKPSRWRRGFTVSLVVGTLIACSGIRQDEFLCENAVAHLVQCCPGFNANAVNCQYDQGCLDTTYPEVDESQSECILGESCGSLRANSVCDRVGQLPFQEGLEDAGSTPAVCTTGPSVPVEGLPDATEDAGSVGPTNQCTGALDCPAGQVCCAVLEPSAALVCARAPCASGIQFCAGSSECPAGEICQTFENAATLLICAAPDASSGGPDDGATTDAASSDGDAQSRGDAGAAADAGLRDASAEAGPDE
jgi:hypothetical protein